MNGAELSAIITASTPTPAFTTQTAKLSQNPRQKKHPASGNQVFLFTWYQSSTPHLPRQISTADTSPTLNTNSLIRIYLNRQDLSWISGRECQLPSTAVETIAPFVLLHAASEEANPLTNQHIILVIYLAA
jgi:hypothetical protein